MPLSAKKMQEAGKDKECFGCSCNVCLLSVSSDGNSEQRAKQVRDLQAEVERLQEELRFLASQAKIVHSSKHNNLLTYKTFPIIVENRCNKALGVVVEG